MFKFVLVKADYLGPTDNSYWALFIENLEDLFSYFEVKTPQLLQAYWEIKSKAIKGIEGHFTSIEQKAIAPLFERPNKNKTLTDDVLLIDDKLNQPKLKAVLAGHKLLINPSGIGFCFYDEKYHTLLERRSSTTFVLPEDKEQLIELIKSAHRSCKAT